MKTIQMADWVQQITGDRAPLKEMREWEHRVVAAYSELLGGYKADVDAILNDIARVKDHPGLVLEQHINFTSVCYHHFLPFFGTVDVAYEPGEIITGLGRIVELVQALAHRLHDPGVPGPRHRRGHPRADRPEGGVRAGAGGPPVRPLARPQ